VTRRIQPRDDLREEMAASEGEPSHPDDGAMGPEEMPDDRTGRTMPVSAAWRLKLITKELKHGGIATCPNAANVTTYLRYHPAWEGCVVYDEFADTIVTTRVPPWREEDMPSDPQPGPWTDGDTGRLVNWIARNESIDVSTAIVECGLATAADTSRVHPVREYLRSLVWDGTKRIERWLHTYLGAEDDLYTSGVGPRWLISAVARIFEPGCQVDCTLILEGLTGAGKTTAFRTLVPRPEWYCDTPLDLANKDALDALRSVWIYGLDELDSLRKGELTRIKNFLTQRFDHYRSPYARRARNYLRQNVFGGTTNEDEYFLDRTGNRRFWPVRVADVIDTERLSRDRDQIWAEAVHLYRLGVPWHVNTGGLRKLCEDRQSRRLVIDPWVGMVRRWLETPTEVVTDGGHTHREPFDVSHGVTTSDGLVHCIGVPRERCDIRGEMRMAAALRACGWQKTGRHVRDGVREYVFLPVPQALPDPDDVDR
jgi:predicted P-loop ATPase